MKPYFDSGFLFKLYWQEPNTPAAQAIVHTYRPPIWLSRFNEIEMLHVARRKSAMRGPGGQAMLLPAQLQRGLTLFKRDLAEGILARIEVDYIEVFEAALELSRRYGRSIPVKTADLLHLAMMSFGYDRFITADRQQHEFASRIGLDSTFLPP